MKITIVQGAFFPIPPLLGGAVEKMWFSLAQEFNAEGHEVYYISKSYKGLSNEDYTQGIHHKRVKGYKAPKSGILLKLLDLFYTFRAVRQISSDTDIIVSNTFWLPILLSSQQKKKCLIDVARIPKGQMKYYTGNGRLRANSTPVAKAIKDEIKKKYFDKVIIIPNTLPFKNDKGVDFNRKEKIILYTGRIHPEKGLDILIDAFSKCKDLGWQLQIVGPYSTETGGGGVSYLNMLKGKANRKNVIFKEPIFDIAELGEIYARASIFVYPSVAELGETFGVSPLEAMSWGCATVVSKLECFKDFLINNENGLCFDHRSENRVEILTGLLNSLMENELQLKTIANRGLTVNETHSNEKLAKEFLNEFDKMKNQ
ncbi:glycosyltransferase family 4 protein [Flavobacterium algicola]|uniref:glycosyltransferase family 4 protein n=1 Tax=Flavobacterium algicola TaxID=556529 RepID=UPI001EFE9948|nr:glycosyltransferase family 4 protein [Flavobacterium algicola]MCG9793522.1 glycosyltransferase family 4 protein [Flavobacterium algicola]